MLVANKTTNQSTLWLVARCTNTQMELDSSLRRSLFLNVTLAMCVCVHNWTAQETFTKKKIRREEDLQD